MTYEELLLLALSTPCKECGAGAGEYCDLTIREGRKAEYAIRDTDLHLLRAIGPLSDQITAGAPASRIDEIRRSLVQAMMIQVRIIRRGE